MFTSARWNRVFGRVARAIATYAIQHPKVKEKAFEYLLNVDEQKEVVVYENMTNAEIVDDFKTYLEIVKSLDEVS